MDLYRTEEERANNDISTLKIHEMSNVTMCTEPPSTSPSTSSHWRPSSGGIGILSASLCLALVALIALGTHIQFIALTSSPHSEKGSSSSSSHEKNMAVKSEINVLIVGSANSPKIESQECGGGHCHFVSIKDNWLGGQASKYNAVVVKDEEDCNECQFAGPLIGHLVSKPGIKFRRDVNFTISALPSSSLPLQRVFFEAKAVNASLPRPPLNQPRHLAAVIMNECESPSGREKYIHAMNKHMTVHVFGACGQPCPTSSSSLAECLFYLNARFKFLLVFESHLCQHYQSDLLYHALQTAPALVPVVFGGIDYNSVLPEHSFIDALNQSPKALAHYLKYLSRHKVDYDKYFDWRSRLELRIVAWPCLLCEALRQGRHLPGGLYKEPLNRRTFPCTKWPDLNFTTM